MLTCFSGQVDAAALDRRPFTFGHQLASHPSLQLESLAKTLPELPPKKVQFSKGLQDLGIHFDSAHEKHKNGLSLEETIEKLKTTSSYIAVLDPEDHPAFRGLYRDLLADVNSLRQTRITEPRMWLFIASPNAMTPFHFDRYSNFLMQIRGSKQVAVFPNFNEEVVPAAECESYMHREEAKPLWKPELDRFAQKFDFRPGDTLHIPYISGHYVKNGPEDISISLSFFFQTEETLRWTHAMQLNHKLRTRLGLNPRPVGHSKRLDAVKGAALPTLRRLRSLVQR
jgi:Cupin-like domain